VVILPAPPGGATARPVPGGHFQLIAREFFVRHQTRDDALENDGPGDEIMVRSDAFRFNSRGEMTREPPRQSGIIGAPGRWDLVGGTAIPGWSASADAGGFKTCDAYPLRPGPVTRGPNLPMVIWDGMLNPASDGVVIVPSIWEMEDRSVSPAQTAWSTNLPVRVARSNGLVARIIGGLPGGPAVSPSLIGPVPVYDDGNRPIGAGTRNPFSSFPYIAHNVGISSPPAIVLTFERATGFAAQPAGATSIGCVPGQIASDAQPLPPGAIVMEFTDPPGNEGDYVLIMQLIRID
jgi:hypothetical protein